MAPLWIPLWISAVLLLAMRARGISIPVKVVKTALNNNNPLLLSEDEGGSCNLTSEGVPNEKKTQAFIVNAAVKHQEILGFGGAFTDAAAHNWKAMSPADQDEVIHAYFGDPSEGGQGYTMGRVPMGSTDFSIYSYNFDNHTDDLKMRYFDMNVTHDQEAMIPMIRAAKARVEARGHDLKLFSSPWSPPAWMKEPVDGKKEMTLSAMPNGLNPKYQGAWALYTSRFVQAYQNLGIKLWGVTVQNEPEASPGWESCKMTADFMANFVRNYLGPTLRRDHPDLKIMGFDHNKDHVFRYTKVLYEDPVTRSYFDGVGVHWYGGLGREGLNNTHFLDPSKFILGTEACNCNGVVTQRSPVQWWSRAEALALDTLEDLKYWSVGWLQWNLVLDTQGGPNHHGNFCDGEIISDPQNTLGLGTVIRQAAYYYMAHFSRFIPPGSRRVEVRNAVQSAVHPLTPKDIQNGKSLLMEQCNDTSAPQRWYYHPATSSLTVWGTQQAAGSDGFEHGMCMDIVDGICRHGQRLQVWACAQPSPSINQMWDLEEVHGGYQIHSRACKDMCVVVNHVDGDAVGLDPGVSVDAAQLGPCAKGGAMGQTFKFSNYPDLFYLPTSVVLDAPVSGQCLQPLAKRQPKFDAVAFQRPDGDMTLVALNLADEGIHIHLHDEVSKAGSLQWIDPHSIVTYTWTPTMHIERLSEPEQSLNAIRTGSLCAMLVLAAAVAVFFTRSSRSPGNLRQRLVAASTA